MECVAWFGRVVCAPRARSIVVPLIVQSCSRARGRRQLGWKGEATACERQVALAGRRSPSFARSLSLSVPDAMCKMVVMRGKEKRRGSRETRERERGAHFWCVPLEEIVLQLVRCGLSENVRLIHMIVTGGRRQAAAGARPGRPFFQTRILAITFALAPRPAWPFVPTSLGPANDCDNQEPITTTCLLLVVSLAANIGAVATAAAAAAAAGAAAAATNN